MSELADRKVYTEKLIANLRTRIGKAESLAIRGQACVYATGSVGRLEAGENSDIDLVMVTKGRINQGRETAESTMGLLDEICLKADIIDAMRNLGVKDLDGQGKFFKKYTALQLGSSIGEQHDDWENTLTSRLLLILESQSILGEDVRLHAIDMVLGAYWTDYEGHQKDYAPAFFTNDILRLWRTFCVNYEAERKLSQATERWSDA